MKKNLLLFFCVFFLNSCLVFHSGNTTSGSLISVSDQYVDIAKGTAESNTILGLVGDVSNDHLILTAKKEMYSLRPLRKGEYYSNVTCDFAKKVILFGLVYNTRVTVSADVMKTGDEFASGFSNAYFNIIRPPVAKAAISEEVKPIARNGNILMNGDSVYYSSNEKKFLLYVATSIDKETVILKPTTRSGENQLVSLNNRFFMKTINFGSFKNGDKIKAELIDVYNATVYEEGLILGSSDSFYLVLTQSGYHVVPETKVRNK
jgi:hypothetical protein